MIAGETAMCKINFVSEFKEFMRYAMQNGLSARERNLWIALFYLANDRARYNEQTGDYDWPDDFFLVANSELNLHSTLDKRGIDTVRNTLKQRGLIDFLPGERNKKNPSYRIHYLTAGENVGFGCKNAPNDAPNNVPNKAPTKPQQHTQYGPRHVPNMPPFYINKLASRSILTQNDFKKDLNIINNNWETSDKARKAVAQKLVDFISERMPHLISPITFDVIEKSLIFHMTPYSVYLVAEASEAFYVFQGYLEHESMPEWVRRLGMLHREAEGVRTA